MRASLATALCAALMLSSAGNAKPKIQSYEAEGNLEATHVLDCITLAEARSDYTPADLYPAVSRCVADGDYESAVALFGLAGVYGRVDIERVSDRTAHQAIAVLQQVFFASLEGDKGAGMMKTLTGVANDPEQLAGVCNAIRSVGPPNYRPTYMIQHGMGAFIGPKTAAPEGFDLDASFAKALVGYLKCPAA